MTTKSERLLLVILYGHNGSSEVANYFGSESFLTLDTDPFFRGYVEGAASQPGLIERSMYMGGGTRGGIDIAGGKITLNNEGRLDYLFPYAFDGRRFYLWDYNKKTRVFGLAHFFGYIEQTTFSGKEINFQARDSNHIFDAPFMTARYAGTNVLPAGVEGTAGDIKGQVKPMVIGIVKNVTPVCVNTSKQIYQLDGQRGFLTGWALTVYDKRAALTAGAVYTSQADMEANAPTAGQYRVWPAGGMFRTNAAHSFLTCDVTNPADLSIGTTHCEAHSILYFLGGFALISLSLVLNNGLSSNPDCGIYLTTDVTRLQAMNEIAQGVNASIQFLISRPSETMTDSAYICSNLTEPTALPYTAKAQALAVGESEIFSIERVVPSDPEMGIPVKRVNVRYAKNYTVQNPTDLAGVALADQAFAGEEYRTASASASITSVWPLAPEVTIDSLIVNEADAQAVADRLIALYSVRRDVFQVRIPAILGRDIPSVDDGLLHRLHPQSQVRITYPRFGLDAGKTFLVIGMVEDIAGDYIDLTLWG